MKQTPLLFLLAIAFVLAGFSSCTTTEKTAAQKEEAADRRVKHATEHIRKVGRARPSGH